MKRITVVLEDGCHLRAKLVATANEMTLNDLCVKAIKQYLQCDCKPGEVGNDLSKCRAIIEPEVDT